ncbi:MAG: hypothetical protein EOL87_08270 [Spartobacteria bacterium]|nr:hypothetical protein [Spartobacteria bacterium]
MKNTIVIACLAFLSGLTAVVARADCEGSGSDGSGGSSSDIVNSWDPNEMAGPLGFGDPSTQRFVRPGEWMDYIVYFENKTNATAAAQEVFVDADLSPLLDWTTFELGEVVFNNQTELGLLGQSGGTITVPQVGSPYQVRIQFTLNPTNGAASWYLRSYDPSQSRNGYWPEEATAGFLPPNDDTFRGEGQLAYRIKVRDDVPAGALIQAAAEIIFDQNAMIPTDPSWWNTVADTNVALLSVTPTHFNFLATASTGTVTITLGSEYSWSASIASGTDWLTIITATNGTGSGTLTFTATAPTKAARNGILLIDDQAVTINQLGLKSSSLGWLLLLCE